MLFVYGIFYPSGADKDDYVFEAKCIDFPGKKIMISKNGESYQTVKLDKVSLFSKHSFWVTSNGDTYVCVYGHSDWSDTRIYKNGKLLYKSDSFRDICVVEE